MGHEIMESGIFQTSVLQLTHATSFLAIETTHMELNLFGPTPLFWTNTFVL